MPTLTELQAMLARHIAAPCLLAPYLPVGGVVLLYGKKSVGKSPLTWSMAHAVATGTPWFSLPVVQGRVLYLEVDTPLHLLTRLKLLPPTDQLSFEAFRGSILRPTAMMRSLFARYPDASLIVINTLRKVHHLPDIGSEVASQVYEAFRAFFPTATLLFVGHDRKSARTAQGSLALPSDEDAAGTQAWRNDAQVTLHLIEETGAEAENVTKYMRLDHTGSQVGLQLPTLHLTLGDDGITLSTRKWIWPGLLAHPNLPISQRIQEASEQCGVSVATAWKVWKALKPGHYSLG